GVTAWSGGGAERWCRRQSGERTESPTGPLLAWRQGITAGRNTNRGPAGLGRSALLAGRTDRPGGDFDLADGAARQEPRYSRADRSQQTSREEGAAEAAARRDQIAGDDRRQQAEGVPA